MEDPAETTARTEEALADRTPGELVNLAKKLRWLGMEEEAAQVQVLLRRANAAVTMLAGPWDTD